jgi:tetratricopeptide (TPR) repeat protein
MRTTSSFEIFPNEPTERVLARARWLRGERRHDESVAAYRDAIEAHPTLRSAWTECFELLRSAGRPSDAHELAIRAERTFVGEAFPLALQGAALTELGEYRKAFETLHRAVERDPTLALTWHELGYAAYRLGEGNRALFALDQAFALEPHTETLVLRGRILRDAGEFYAAEVAFEGAYHSAQHDDQQTAIRHEIDVTHRLGGFPPSWVRELTTAELWFAEHGTVVVSSLPGERAPTVDEIVAAFVELIRDRGWAFDQLVTSDDHAAWETLARPLGIPIVRPGAMTGEGIPLLVSTEPSDSAEWQGASEQLAATGRGTTFVLIHPADRAPEVDIAGALAVDGTVLPLTPSAVDAMVMAQHPAARIAKRVLGPTPTPAEAG